MNRYKFDEAIACVGFGYTETADFLGITTQKLEEKLSGTEEFISEEITKLASRTGLTPDGIDEVFFGAERGTEFKQNFTEQDAGFPLFWEMIDSGEAVCGGTISSSQELLDLIAKNKGRRMVLRIG